DQAFTDCGDGLDHGFDRPGCDLARCGGSAYGRGRLEPPAQHRLRHDGLGTVPLPTVTRNIPRAVSDERNVVLAHDLEGAKSPRARSRCEGISGARYRIEPLHGIFRSRLDLGLSWLRAVRHTPQ